MFGLKNLTLALALATATANPFAAKVSQKKASVAYANKLVRGSTVIRHLEEGDDGAEAEEVDLTGYYLKFQKCQFVKAYSQDLAEEGADTVLETQRFVVFRLCPSSSSCNKNYGEYMIDMNDYLQYTVEYRAEEQEEMCNTCDEQCYYANGDDAAAEEEEEAADDAAAEEEEEEADYYEEEAGDDARRRRLDNSADCSTCVSDCAKIANMADNYYVDATDFINCVQVSEEADDIPALYGGPMCASQGSKIKIGVFSDDECKTLTNYDVEDYLTDDDGNAMKISHSLLKTTYSNDELISCSQVVADDDAAEVENVEVCENLYQEAAKCEQYGFSPMEANDYYDADNQVANSELVCDFILSLKTGTYSQDGEIVIGGVSRYTGGSSATTGGQKFALTFFILGTVGCAVYAAMLHSQLTKGGKADLASQGGAMA